MKFLLDSNLSHRVAQLLRDAGISAAHGDPARLHWMFALAPTRHPADQNADALTSMLERLDLELEVGRAECHGEVAEERELAE